MRSKKRRMVSALSGWASKAFVRRCVQPSVARLMSRVDEYGFPEPLGQPKDEVAKGDVRVDVPFDPDRSQVGTDGLIVPKVHSESARIEVRWQGTSSSTQSAFSMRWRT